MRAASARNAMILVPSLLLAACAGPSAYIPKPTTWATSDGYSELVGTWIGSDANDLVRSWGPPDSEFAMPNGNRHWTYMSRSSYQTPVTSKTYYSESDNTITTQYSGGDVFVFSCDTEFEVSATGRVIDWSWSGNNCKAVPSVKPTDCTGGTYNSKIIGYERTERRGQQVVRLDLRGDEYAYVDASHYGDILKWRYTTQRIGVCINSGVGTYIMLYPQIDFWQVLE